LEHVYDLPYIGKNIPNWFIFFRGVGQPPTRYIPYIIHIIHINHNCSWVKKRFELSKG
jgi:hypothetical protein